MDRGNDIVPTRRTSLIVEPANGRVPPFTAAAQREHERNLAHAKEHPADTPEDRYLTERCIGFGGGHAPMLPEPYNNNYYIVQTPDYVTIMAELNHEVRIIPIDGRPHLPAGVTQWTGDSRGRWEGDTLVVETTNQIAASALLRRADARFRDERRVSRRRALHAHRAEIRSAIARPCTTPCSRRRGPSRSSCIRRPGELVEFACHEGNYGLRGHIVGHARGRAASNGGQRR